MSIRNNFPTIRPSLNLDFANVKALDPRITFTRTTTATYYDGKTTAKAEENLLIGSQQLSFSAAAYWPGTGLTSVDADTQVAPDGTTTADVPLASSGGTLHFLQQTVSAVAGAYTFSVFLKEGTSTFAAIRIATDGNAKRFGVVVNLSLGTVTTTLSSGTPVGTSSSITSVGNGWYRVTATATNTSGTVLCAVALSDSGTPVNDAGLPSFSAAGTETVYAWGAQLEQRSAVSAYTPTTTQPITNYIPQLLTAAAGQARFDHNPITGESLGLLVEEQRTNQLQRSDDFANAYWTKTRSSITSNTIVAPDGTLTGDKLVEDTTATNTHDTYAGNYSASSTTITVSVYAKAGERPRLLLEISNFLNGSASAIFNLTTGATSNTGSTTADYTSVSSSIQSVGNGWYRCVLTATKGTANSNNYFVINLDNGTTRSYTGDGYSGAFLWGAQLEAGAFPTSYIPTVAATVTRNADAASMTGTNFSSWYRADEGTLYAESRVNFPTAGTSFPRVVEISDSSTNNFIALFATRGVSPAFTGRVTVNSVNQADFGSFTAISSVAFKVNLAYKANDFAIALNGGSLNTDASGTIPTVTQMFIGDRLGGDRPLNGHIRKLAFYPSRLSDSQLQALTTV